MKRAAYLGGEKSTSVPIAVEPTPHTAIYPVIGDNDESRIETTYPRRPLEALEDRSAFWWKIAQFEGLQKKLQSTALLRTGWNGDEAEAPNDLARQQTTEVLRLLERSYLVPTHLGPSAEGGIGLSFAAGDKRAVVEFYNTGEIVAGTYANEGNPEAWEIDRSDYSILNAINRIRVHLTE